MHLRKMPLVLLLIGRTRENGLPFSAYRRGLVPIFDRRLKANELRTSHRKKLFLTPAFELALTSGAVACAMHATESVSQIAFLAALE